MRHTDERWTGGTKGQGQIEKSETKGGAQIDRKGQQMTRRTDRQTQGQMGGGRDKHIDQEKLGLVPAQIKAHGLEVKGCGLCR